jgi:hypothetical protein
MCQACFDQDFMIRKMLLDHPEEREKLTAEGADYYGFKKDAAGRWVDAWAGQFEAEAVEPAQ